MLPSCSAEHIGAEQPTTFSFFYLLEENFLPMPNLKKKQALKDETKLSLAA